MSLPCFRCGDLLRENMPVRGIPFCASCLTARREEPPPLVTISPAIVIRARLKIMAAFWVPGFVLGAIVGRFEVAEILSVVPGPITAPASFSLVTIIATGMVGAVLVQSVGMLFLLARIQFAGNEAWKREFLAALAIPEVVGKHAIGEALLIVLARRLGSNPLAPEQGIFAAYTAGGIVFFGKRGTRLALPLAEIARVSVPRWAASWPVRPLRVELTSGEVWDFAFQEGTTFRRANRWAEFWAEKLRRA